MPAPDRRRFVSRPLAAATIVALGLTTTGGAWAAEAPVEGSLCDAISLDELNGLGPLLYDATGFESDEICVFEASATQPGAHSLTLSTSGISFDLMRQAYPDLVEITVGDHPAIAFEGALLVGLDDGERIFSVSPEFAASDAAAGIDPIEYAIDVAEIVLPRLALATAAGSPESESTIAEPPEVAGISWRLGSLTTGDDLQGPENEQQAAVFLPLLDAVGAGPELFSLAGTTAADAETGDRIGDYSVIRITDVEEERLEGAIVDWLRVTSAADDFEARAETIGGKDVLTLSFAGQTQGYLYVIGDTAHAVTMSEDAAAKVLEALP